MIDSLRKALQYLHTDGFVATAMWAFRATFYYAPRRWWFGRFDRKYGVDTTLPLELNEYSRKDLVQHAISYSCTPVNVFNRLMKGQGLDFSTYTYIDLGSGKGRTLLLASFFPFKRIIGIEFEPTLHAVCERNIASLCQKKSKQGPPMRSVCADAGTYDLPEGNLLLYMANPFDGQIMARVNSKIIQSLNSARHIRIVYFHPNQLEILLRVPNMKLLSRSTFYDSYSIGNIGRVAVLEVAATGRNAS